MSVNEAAGFSIWIDNDGCPRSVRELVCKAGARRKIPIKLVANSYMHPPKGQVVEVICAGSAFDAADDYIADNVGQGDIVITADVPLADRVIDAGAVAVNPRGEIYDSETIKERLTMRNLNQELRSAGEISGGPAAFGAAEIQRFAAAFDKVVTRALKK